MKIFYPAFLLVVFAPLFACGPTANEGWNSYYYGTGRASSTYYNRYPSDNDATYVMPWGTWQDDQMPQGQKW